MRKTSKTKRAADKRQPAHGSHNRRSTPRKRRAPYIRRLERRGPLDVWLVDGSFIRKNRDEEFSNFGHHWSFAELIPKKEIWIDVESDPDELRFFIAHAVRERRLMADGADYDTARRKANAHERKLRVAAGDVRKVTGGG